MVDDLFVPSSKQPSISYYKLTDFRIHNIQMEIPILEQGASKLWTAEHRAWNSVRNFPLESTTPSTRNWPTRLLFYFCAKPGFFFIPKILLFLTRVHFNWWLIGVFLTASWRNIVLGIAFSSWDWPTRLLFYSCAKLGLFFNPKILLLLTRVHFSWWLIHPFLTASLLMLSL